MIKLRDLDGTMTLTGVRVKTPDGRVGLWKSQWAKGVWLSDGESHRIYPVFVDDLSECLEWEVTEEEININKNGGL